MARDVMLYDTNYQVFLPSNIRDFLEFKTKLKDKMLTRVGALVWFVESRNTSEEDLVVGVVEHDITSHKEGDTTLSAVTRITTTVLANAETDNSEQG